MDLRFSGDVLHWRGPAPYHFVPVAPAEADALRAVAGLASYGWGVIPVTVTLGGTTWTTSLFPKDGGYLVPVKDAVRRAEGVDVGDTVTLRVVVAGV